MAKLCCLIKEVAALCTLCGEQFCEGEWPNCSHVVIPDFTMYCPVTKKALSWKNTSFCYKHSIFGICPCLVEQLKRF